MTRADGTPPNQIVPEIPTESTEAELAATAKVLAWPEAEIEASPDAPSAFEPEYEYDYEYAGGVSAQEHDATAGIGTGAAANRMPTSEYTAAELVGPSGAPRELDPSEYSQAELLKPKHSDEMQIVSSFEVDSPGACENCAFDVPAQPYAG